mmetsp:Transcript_169018/g.410782  ORF Transcript_169018/g.410782 Transcript_169018/m.410782 type:complete len:428 (+) Transcript_169018:505-1788(+)
MLGRESNDALRQAVYLALGHPTASKELLEHALQGPHAVAHQEDGRGRRLAVRCEQRGRAAQTDGLERRIVVLVFPLGELLQHRLRVRDVLEAVAQDARQARELRLEAEEHGGDRGLDLVEDGRAGVAVVEDGPLAAELRLVLEHLVEALAAVRVLGDRGPEVALPLAQRLRPPLPLRRHQRRRQAQVEGGAHAGAGGRGALAQAAQDLGVAVVLALDVAQGLGAARGRALELPRGAAVRVRLRHDVEVEDVEAVEAGVEGELLGHEGGDAGAERLLEEGLVLRRERGPLAVVVPPLPQGALRRGGRVLPPHLPALLAGLVRLQHLLEVHFIYGVKALVECEIGGRKLCFRPTFQIPGFQHCRVLWVKRLPLLTIPPFPRNDCAGNATLFRFLQGVLLCGRGCLFLRSHLKAARAGGVLTEMAALENT